MKSYQIVILVTILILGICFIFYKIGEPTWENQKIRDNYCKAENISNICYYPNVNCYYDCKALNQTYLQAKGSGWGHSEECWCVNKDGESNKIW